MIGAIAESVVTVLVLFVFAWVAIFGGVSVVLARRRGIVSWRALLLGAATGPVAWSAICHGRPGRMFGWLADLPLQRPSSPPVRSPSDDWSPL